MLLSALDLRRPISIPRIPPGLSARTGNSATAANRMSLRQSVDGM